MGKWMTFAGLLSNLIGVFLIFRGAKPYKELPIGGQASSKDTGYLYVVDPPFFLPLGLGLIILGNVLQMIGIWIN